MERSMLEIMNEHNLCTFYLLPLIRLNKSSFDEMNFVESFVHPEGKYLYVHVLEKNKCFPDVFQTKFYLGEERITPGYLLWYWFPLKVWKREFELFKQGKYSELSDRAKEKIIRYSGLMWKQEIPGYDKPFTDYRLMVLDRSPVLRRVWDMELGVAMTDENELAPPPSEKSYLSKEQEP